MTLPDDPAGVARATRGNAVLWIAGLAIGAPAMADAVDPALVPEPKRTRAGPYLQARDVPAFTESHGGAPKVLFLDVRTRAEAMFVGMPTTVDALVPFVELQETMTDGDPRRGAYRLEPVQGFPVEVARRLQDKQLTRSDPVVLTCRSGDRSSRAAARLAEEGHTAVYMVVDGFEGDMSPQGRRDVNGWRKAGLPWTYKLDRSKLYFPR